MDGYLKVVAPYLDQSIVNREALSRIHAVARHLPRSSLAGFEVRLSEGESSVDFCIRLPRPTLGLTSPLVSNAVWQRIQQLAESVMCPGGTLNGRVTQVMLEFDLEAPPTEIPIPGLFVTLSPNHPWTARALCALAHWVQPERPVDLSCDALIRCQSALPPQAGFGQIGLMFSRSNRNLRVVTRSIPLTELLPSLHGIGWRDPGGLLVKLVDEIASFADPAVVLDLDLSESLLPRIGVEFYVRHADDAPRWRALFACLVARGLASPRRVSGLLAWPGLTQHGSNGSPCADDLTFGDALFGEAATSVFWRCINHVKLSYQPGQAPQIKAYLAFGHTWISTAVAAASA